MSTGDVNNLAPGYWNLRASDGDIENAPTESPCFLFVSPYAVMRNGQGYYQFQLAVVGDNGEDIYYRIYTSSWMAWKHISV